MTGPKKMVARVDTCRLATEALRADRPLRKSKKNGGDVGYEGREIEAWEANKANRLGAIAYVLHNGEAAPFSKSKSGVVTWELP